MVVTDNLEAKLLLIFLLCYLLIEIMDKLHTGKPKSHLHALCLLKHYFWLLKAPLCLANGGIAKFEVNIHAILLTDLLIT